MLATGSARAEVVSLSGLGRTLPDGHYHEVRWCEELLRAQLRLKDVESQRAGADRQITSGAGSTTTFTAMTRSPTSTAPAVRVRANSSG